MTFLNLLVWKPHCHDFKPWRNELAAPTRYFWKFYFASLVVLLVAVFFSDHVVCLSLQNRRFIKNSKSMRPVLQAKYILAFDTSLFRLISRTPCGTSISLRFSFSLNFLSCQKYSFVADNYDHRNFYRFSVNFRTTIVRKVRAPLWITAECVPVGCVNLIQLRALQNTSTQQFPLLLKGKHVTSRQWRRTA